MPESVWEVFKSELNRRVRAPGSAGAREEEVADLLGDHDAPDGDEDHRHGPVANERRVPDVRRQPHLAKPAVVLPVRFAGRDQSPADAARFFSQAKVAMEETQLPAAETLH